MNYQELARKIYINLESIGFTFIYPRHEAIAMIINLIDDGDYDLKSVVIYIVKHHTK